jgi:hypothetical protein
MRRFVLGALGADGVVYAFVSAVAESAWHPLLILGLIGANALALATHFDPFKRCAGCARRDRELNRMRDTILALDPSEAPEEMTDEVEALQ